MLHDFGRHEQVMHALQRMFGPYPFGEYAADDLDDPIEASASAARLTRNTTRSS